MLPSATDINYADPDEVIGYHLLLVRLFDREGGFADPRPQVTPALTTITRHWQYWLRQVRHILHDTMQSGANTNLAPVPRLLQAYDLAHRAVNGHPDRQFITRSTLTTIKQWLQGNKTITATDATLMIARQLRQPATLESRYISYYYQVESQWVDQLRRYDGFLSLTTPAEPYQRLSHLLDIDLSHYLGTPADQRHHKRCWVTDHLVTDPATLTTPALQSYIAFTQAAARHNLLPATTATEALISTLASRPDLNPYHRASLREISLPIVS